MARPFLKDDIKKKAISIKLPPYLLEWMDRQPEKRPELIERALVGYFQIPDHLKPNKQGE